MAMDEFNYGFRNISKVKFVICPRCRGDGFFMSDGSLDIHGFSKDQKKNKCFECNGTGRILEFYSDAKPKTDQESKP